LEVIETGEPLIVVSPRTILSFWFGETGSEVTNVSHFNISSHQQRAQRNVWLFSENLNWNGKWISGFISNWRFHSTPQKQLEIDVETLSVSYLRKTTTIMHWHFEILPKRFSIADVPAEVFWQDVVIQQSYGSSLLTANSRPVDSHRDPARREDLSPMSILTSFMPLSLLSSGFELMVILAAAQLSRSYRYYIHQEWISRRKFYGNCSWECWSGYIHCSIALRSRRLWFCFVFSLDCSCRTLQHGIL